MARRADLQSLLLLDTHIWVRQMAGDQNLSHRSQRAIDSGQLPGGFRSDPADQIIVATARITGATLMTRDRRILAYAGAGRLNAVAA